MIDSIGRPVFVGELAWDRIEALQREGIRRWLAEETNAGARVWVEPENHSRAVEAISLADF